MIPIRVTAHCCSDDNSAACEVQYEVDEVLLAAARSSDLTSASLREEASASTEGVELLKFLILSMLPSADGDAEKLLLLDYAGRELHSTLDLLEVAVTTVSPASSSDDSGSSSVQQQECLEVWCTDLDTMDPFRFCSALTITTEYEGAVSASELLQPCYRLLDIPYQLCCRCSRLFDASLLQSSESTNAALQRFVCSGAQAVGAGFVPPSAASFLASEMELIKRRFVNHPLPPALQLQLRRRFLIGALSQQQLALQYVASGAASGANTFILQAQQVAEGVNAFRGRVDRTVQTVITYERQDLRQSALRSINYRVVYQYALAYREKQQNAICEIEALLVGLMQWFKCDFFSWCNKPCCSNVPVCGARPNRMEAVGTVAPTDEEKRVGWAGRTELYRCKECQQVTRFPRYNNPAHLLTTRTGRCGEWANAFGLICRALNLDVRYVMDFTDHVWLEVWVPSKLRFVHCDPCERTFDKPLMYEQGWNKKLTHLLSCSRYGIVDATARYSRKQDEVLARRDAEVVLESSVSHILQEKDTELQRNFNPTLGSDNISTSQLQMMAAGNVDAIQKLHSFDISIDEMKQRKRLLRRELYALQCELRMQLQHEEMQGRISGSAEWKRSRGEDGGSAVRGDGEGNPTILTPRKLPNWLCPGIILSSASLCGREIDTFISCHNGHPLVPDVPSISAYENDEKSEIMGLRSNGLFPAANQRFGFGHRRMCVDDSHKGVSAISLLSSSCALIDISHGILNNSSAPASSGTVTGSLVATPEDTTMVQLIAALGSSLAIDHSLLQGTDILHTATNGDKVLQNPIILHLLSYSGSKSMLLTRCSGVIMTRHDDDVQRDDGLDPMFISISFRCMVQVPEKFISEKVRLKDRVEIEMRRQDGYIAAHACAMKVIPAETKEYEMAEFINDAIQCCLKDNSLLGFSVVFSNPSASKDSQSASHLLFFSDLGFPLHRHETAHTFVKCSRTGCERNLCNSKYLALVDAQSILQNPVASAFQSPNEHRQAASVTIGECAPDASPTQTGLCGNILRYYHCGGGHHGDTMNFDTTRFLQGWSSLFQSCATCDSAPPSLDLSHIVVYAGSNFVNGIQCWYTVNDGNERSQHVIIKGPFCSSENDDPIAHHLDLHLAPTASGADAAGQYTLDRVVSVKVKHGALVDSISFTTASGRSLFAGGTGGGEETVFEFPQQAQALFGFFGGTGGHLHNVGFIVRELFEDSKSIASLTSPETNTKIATQSGDAVLTPLDPKQKYSLVLQMTQLFDEYSMWDCGMLNSNQEEEEYFRLPDTARLIELLSKVLLLNAKECAVECLHVIILYLENIVKDPLNEKFQNVKLTNAKFQRSVAAAAGGLELFCFGPGGFQLSRDGNSLQSQLHSIHFKRDPSANFRSMCCGWIRRFIKFLRATCDLA